MLERGLVSRILFPVPPPSYDVDCFPSDLIWVPKNPDKRDSNAAPPLFEDSVPCLLLTYPSARFLIIFFHSNAEDLGRCHGFCCYIRDQFQVHVLAVEYPGYGICPGTPSGETVMENALAAVRFATDTLRWPLDSIKVFGRSIGTGPAIGLASLFSFAGVILVTPFLSVQELFRDRVGPFASLVEEWFANQDAAPKITSPTIIIHGQRDELIACRHGESIYELLRARKMLVSPPDMEHNTNLLTNLKFFVLPMFQFFALPDYVFQDLHVPPWAYDKRRSPYYVRPGVEISSHQLPTSPGKKQLTMPSGDNGSMPVAGEREPLKKEQVVALKQQLNGKAKRDAKKALGASSPGKHRPNRALAPLFTQRDRGNDKDEAAPAKPKASSGRIALGDDDAPEDTHVAAPVGASSKQQSVTDSNTKGDEIGSNVNGTSNALATVKPSIATLANGKDPLNVSPEAREAIRRLEDFAGKLCAYEICSDELCVREERTEDDEDLQKREKALAQLKSPTEVSSCLTAPARERKTGIVSLGCGGNDSVWMRWCSRGASVDTAEVESEMSLNQTRRVPAPGLPHAGSVPSPRSLPLGSRPAAPRMPPCQAGEEVDTGIWEDWHNCRQRDSSASRDNSDDDDQEAWHETSSSRPSDGPRIRVGRPNASKASSPSDIEGLTVKPPASKPAAPGREVGKSSLVAVPQMRPTKSPVLFTDCCKPLPTDQRGNVISDVSGQRPAAPDAHQQPRGGSGAGSLDRRDPESCRNKQREMMIAGAAESDESRLHQSAQEQMSTVLGNTIPRGTKFTI